MRVRMTTIQDTYVCNSVVLAQYITSHANACKVGINMTKLQKLLYITYGVYLAVKGERLTNEHPQAWPYGPVFPTTRSKLLKCNLEEIVDFDSESITDEIKACVDLVFRSFGAYTGSFLSAWSQKPNSPWDRTARQHDFEWGDTIPDEYILNYFRNLLVKK